MSGKLQRFFFFFFLLLLPPAGRRQPAAGVFGCALSPYFFSSREQPAVPIVGWQPDRSAYRPAEPAGRQEAWTYVPQPVWWRAKGRTGGACRRRSRRSDAGGRDCGGARRKWQRRRRTWARRYSQRRLCGSRLRERGEVRRSRNSLRGGAGAACADAETHGGARAACAGHGDARRSRSSLRGVRRSRPVVRGAHQPGGARARTRRSRPVVRGAHQPGGARARTRRSRSGRPRRRRPWAREAEPEQPTKAEAAMGARVRSRSSLREGA
jgi:hypothetical protein